MNCYCPPHSLTDYAYAVANQTRARPKFLSTLRKSGPRPSPTQNLGQVSLGRAQVFRVHTSVGQAQVFENLGRAWASLCSVDTAIDTKESQQEVEKLLKTIHSSSTKEMTDAQTRSNKEHKRCHENVITLLATELLLSECTMHL